MKKMQKVEFHDSRAPDGATEGFSFLVADGEFTRSVRTLSKKGWPREAYHETSEDTDTVHFISYDSNDKSYFLESAVRIGKGQRREEARMTVDEIRAKLSGEAPDSMESIVTVLAEELDYSGEGFVERPTFELKPGNRPIDPDDVLASGHGAVCLCDEHREIVRQFIASDPVEKKDLPEGVLTLTET